MPNRILKESICTSDSINALGWFEEVLYYRLIVNCDDFGRFDGRTAVIKNRLFPLKDSLTAKNVETAVNKLARAGLVTPYESGGKPFLFLPTWNEHQSIRAKKSKYPEPENICKHLQADESKCPRNPIQSESNPNPMRNANDTHALEGVGEVLQTAFAEWLQYKAERKEKYTPTGLSNLQAEVKNNAARFGEAAVAELIRKCMASGWRGIIFEKLAEAPVRANKGPSYTPPTQEQIARQSEDMARTRRLLERMKQEEANGQG